MKAHEIDKLTIKTDKKLPAELQKFIQEDTKKIILKYFDRYFPSDQLLVINRIALDLGTIRKGKYFRQEFSVRLSYLLDTELARFFQDTSNQTLIEKNITFNVVENFAFYLKAGFTRVEGVTLINLFEKLLNEHIQYLREIVESSGESEEQSRRLLYQIPFSLLERYWQKVFPDLYERVRKINLQIVSDLELRLSDNTSMKPVTDVLRMSTFKFLAGEIPKDHVELVYLLFLRDNSTELGKLVPQRAYQVVEELYYERLPIKRSAKDTPQSLALEAILFYMETGHFDQSHSARSLSAASRISRVEISKLLKVLLPVSERFPVRIKRLIYILTSREMEWLVVEMRALVSNDLLIRVKRISYLRKAIGSIFSVDLYTFAQVFIGEYLSQSRPDEKRELFLLTELLKLVAAKKGTAISHITDKLYSELAFSLYHEGIVLKEQLRALKSSSIIVDDQQPSEEVNGDDDLLVIYQFFLKTGIWNLKDLSPLEILQQLLESSADRLVLQLTLLIKHQSAWIRLIHQTPIELIRIIVNRVFSNDPALKFLNNVLDGDIKSIDQILVQRRVLELFISLKVQDHELSQDQFELIFQQRGQHLLDSADQDDANTSVNLYSEAREAVGHQQEFAEIYISSFLHFIKFNRHVYQHVEEDGLDLALEKIINQWQIEFITQLSIDSDARRVLVSIFDRLNEVDQIRIFLPLIPDYKQLFDTVYQQIMSEYDVRSSDLLANWFVVIVRNASKLDPDQLVSLLLSEMDLAHDQFLDFQTDDTLIIEDDPEKVKDFEWDDWVDERILRWGITPDRVNEFTVFDLIEEIIRKGKFPTWSLVYSKRAFLSLLNRVAEAEPVLLDHIFNTNFKDNTAVKRLLFVIGYDDFVSLIEKLGNGSVMEMRRIIDALVLAHDDFGNRDSLKDYFFNNYIIELYAANYINTNEVVNSMLQRVHSDFGLSAIDYLKIVKKVNLAVVNHFIDRLTKSVASDRSTEVELEDIEWLIDLLRDDDVNRWRYNFITSELEKNDTSLGVIITELLLKQPDKVITAIHNSPDADKIYTRILSRLSSHQFSKMLGMLAPKEASQIVSFIQLLTRWSGFSDQQRWRTLIMHVLVESRKENMNIKQFVENSLMQISNAMGIKIATLVNELSDEWKRYSIEHDVFFEEVFSKWIQSDEIATLTEEVLLSEHLEILIDYLRSGSFPVDLSRYQIPAKKVEHFIHELLIKQDAKTIRLVESVLQDERIRIRVVNEEEEAFVELLIDLLFSRNTKRLNHLKEQVNNFIQKQRSSISIRTLNKLFYKYILEELIAPKNIISSDSELIANYLIRTSQEFNLLISFQEQSWIGSGLDPQIIAELTKMNSSSIVIVNSKIIVDDDLDEFTKSLTHWLLTGLWPDLGVGSGNSKNEFIKELQVQLSTRNTRITSLVTDLLSRDAVRGRVIKTEEFSLLAILSRVLYPEIIHILDDYKEKLARFFQDQQIGVSFLTLHRLYYQSILNDYYQHGDSSISSDQLVVNYILTVQKFFKLVKDVEFKDLLHYGFSQSIISQLELNGTAISDESEKLISEAVHISDDLLLCVDHYLRFGILPEGSSSGINSLDVLLKHLQQQASFTNRPLQKMIVKALQDEKVKIRVINEEGDDLLMTLLLLCNPLINQRFFRFRDHVIRFILSQNPSGASEALMRVFYHSSFELIRKNRMITVKELITSFIDASFVTFQITLNARREALYQFGFDSVQQRLISSYLIARETNQSNQKPSINISRISADSDSTVSANQVKAIEHYLRTGTFSVKYSTKIINRAQLIHFIQHAVTRGNNELRARLVDLLDDEKIRSGIIEEEDQEFQFLILGVLYPQGVQKLRIYKEYTFHLLLDKQVSLAEQSLNRHFIEHAFEFLKHSNNGQEDIERWITSFIQHLLKQYNFDLLLDVEELERYGFNRKISIAITRSLRWKESSADIKLPAQVESAWPMLAQHEDSINHNINLLIHLVIQEEMPAWAVDHKWVNSQVQDIDSLIDQLALWLFTNYPKELMASVHKTNKQHQLCQRLLPLLSQVQYERVVIALAASFGHFINSFTELISEWRSNIPQTMWRSFILKHLNQEQSFHSSKFIESSLVFLSGVMNMNHKQLRNQLFTLANQQWKKGEWRYAPFPELLFIHDNKENDKEEMFEALRQSWSLEKTLSFYLRTGMLPSGVFSSIKDYSALVDLINRQVYLGVESIRNVILDAWHDTETRSRIIDHEQSSFLFMIMRVAYPQYEQQLRIFKGTITPFFSSRAESFELKSFDKLFFQTVFELLARNQAGITAEELVTAFMVQASEAFKLRRGFYSSTLLRYGFSHESIEQLVNATTRFLKEDNRSSSRKLTPEELLDHRIMIKNAGMVIIAPYLTRYFDLLGMTENSLFKSDDEAVRAVHLLQYVATGLASAPEHELLLNKILCGVALTTPVPIEITLTDKEKEVTSMMLNGVLQNWDKLRNSSIQALQEGFMIRDGAVQEKEEMWHLNVEKKTLDILMESLPWSFGTIKLPWMKKRLVVEWL